MLQHSNKDSDELYDDNNDVYGQWFSVTQSNPLNIYANELRPQRNVRITGQ